MAQLPTSGKNALLEVAQLHASGDNVFGIDKHWLPIHVDARSRSKYFNTSKVIQKLQSMEAKVQFLLHPDDV